MSFILKKIAGYFIVVLMAIPVLIAALCVAALALIFPATIQGLLYGISLATDEENYDSAETYVDYFVGRLPKVNPDED